MSENVRDGSFLFPGQMAAPRPRWAKHALSTTSGALWPQVVYVPSGYQASPSTPLCLPPYPVPCWLARRG